jgi:hypothetical protein
MQDGTGRAAVQKTSWQEFVVKGQNPLIFSKLSFLVRCININGFKTYIFLTIVLDTMLYLTPINNLAVIFSYRSYKHQPPCHKFLSQIVSPSEAQSNDPDAQQAATAGLLRICGAVHEYMHFTYIYIYIHYIYIISWGKMGQSKNANLSADSYDRL